MEITHFKTHYRHILGMFLLGHWLYKNNVIDNKKLLPSDRIIKIPAFLSERFHFVTNTPKSNSPSLCAERDIMNWLGRVSFNRLLFNEDDFKIYLVTERVNGDGGNIQDVGEIAIELTFDKRQKFQFLKEKKRCLIKELYIENGFVTLSKGIFGNIPIISIDNTTPIFDKKELRDTITFANVIERGISSTNIHYATYNGMPSKDYAPIINAVSKGLGSALLEDFDENRLFEINPDMQRIPDYYRELEKMPAAKDE